MDFYNKPMPSEYCEYLEHHGIKGMKWGVRRTPEQLGHLSPKKKQSIAKRDAKKFVRAKMGYGEGAGTRRKLLKAELSEKMKDSEYKDAFDNYVKNADYEKAGKFAKRERTVKNITSNKLVRTGAKVAGASALLGVTYKACSTNPTLQRKGAVFVDEIKNVGIVNMFTSGQYTKAGRQMIFANAIKKAIFA